MENIDLTDHESLVKLGEEIENERIRLFEWSKIEEFRDQPKIKERYLFRCRRLAKIRENLKMLAETYE